MESPVDLTYIRAVYSNLYTVRMEECLTEDSTEGRAAPNAHQSIGDVAALVGVSPGTIRLWESQGFVRPSRVPGGRRQYSQSDLSRLREVRYLRSVEGLNAPAIRQRLEAQGRPASLGPDGGAASPAERAVDGRRLRRLRLERGMTLQEAARRTGLSASFISSVERGTSGASPTAMTRLREAYEDGVEPAHEDLGISVHRIGDGHSTEVAPGVQIEWLSVHPGLLEPQLYRLAPGAASPESYQHKGEEFLLTLAGTFSITINGETHTLAADDSVHFPSHLPHRWRNPGDVEARVVWVTTERGLWRRKERQRPAAVPGADKFDTGGDTS